MDVKPKRTRSQIGKYSRSKGKAGEHWLVNKVKSIFPHAKRHLEFQKQEAKGYDLDNTGNLRFQMKNYKDYCPISKIKEVVKESDSDIPVLVTKGVRKPAVACLYLDDLIKILEDVGEAYGVNLNDSKDL